MPFDSSACGISRDGVEPGDIMKIGAALRRLIATATRDQPRAPHEQLWIGGRINDLERHAVDRLLADCEMVALGHGGDRRDTVPEFEFTGDDEPGADILAAMSTGHCEYLETLGLFGGTDPATISTAPDPGAFEWRALNRAHARGRVERALEAVGEDRYQLLRFLLNGATDAALADQARTPRSTMRGRLVSCIRALCRHYEREDRRKLKPPPTRKTATAKAVAEHYASTGPAGHRPPPAKRQVPFFDQMPSVLGDYAEAAGALIEVDKLQRMMMGENWFAEYAADLDAIAEGTADTDDARKPSILQ